MKAGLNQADFFKSRFTFMSQFRPNKADFPPSITNKGGNRCHLNNNNNNNSLY